MRQVYESIRERALYNLIFQASFTIKELRELLNLENAPVHCEIDPTTHRQIKIFLKNPDLPRKNRRILELMLSRCQPEPVKPTSRRHGSIIFHRKPEKVILTSSHDRIQGLLTQDVLTGKQIEMPCDLLIYAIGFTSSHLPGVPVCNDQKLRLLDWCRVDEARANVYATGWCAQVCLFILRRKFRVLGWRRCDC